MGLRESARLASERIRERNTGCSGLFVLLASITVGFLLGMLDRVLS